MQYRGGRCGPDRKFPCGRFRLTLCLEFGLMSSLHATGKFHCARDLRIERKINRFSLVRTDGSVTVSHYVRSQNVNVNIAKIFL